MERIQGLVREGRDLDAARRGMFGMAEKGGTLWRQEYDAWRARLRRDPRAVVAGPDEAERVRADLARVFATWKPPGEVS